MGHFFDGVSDGREGPIQADLHRESIGRVVLKQGKFLDGQWTGTGQRRWVVART